MELKQKTCKICKVKYIPARPLQSVCSPKCAIIVQNKERVKLWSKEKKEVKEKIKTKGEHLSELQDIFNLFIRIRDKNLPCVSCGTVSNTIKYDAGHYFSKSAYSGLRLHEDNVHKQCSRFCNVGLSGNLIPYRENLIKKIGIERFNWLDEHKHDKLELSILEIKELKVIYKAKIKELKSI